MMTLIVYDAYGKIVSIVASDIISDAETYAVITADVPEGKFVKSVNPQTREVYLENIAPDPQMQEIEELREAASIFATAATTLTDEQALSMPEFFAEWEPDTKYVYGQVIRRNSQLYRIEQSEVTSIESQPPEAEGMLAVYRPIVLDHEGTLEDPIPWVYGMDCYSGKYYSHNGKVYKCTGDMIPCVWEPGSAGVYQWEEIA